MDLNKISYCQQHADTQLKARKDQILELMEQFEEMGLDVCHAALGEMINDIEQIDRLLEV